MICPSCTSKYPDEELSCPKCDFKNPNAEEIVEDPTLPGNKSAGLITSCSGCVLFPLVALIAVQSVFSGSTMDSAIGAIIGAGILSLVLVVIGLVMVNRSK